MRLLNRSQSVKRFWTYVKHVTGKIKLSTIPDLEVDQDGTQVCVTSDANKASALNRHFARQTCLTNCPESFPDFAPPSQASPDSFSTTPAEVFGTLSGIKWGKAPGLDEVPPKLLSLCARGISVSLCDLFNRSFTDGCVPAAWKEALVIPVYKSGPKSCPSNYRPIALLSIVNKGREKIVLKCLSAYLDPLLTTKQTGFRRNDGTCPQLLRLVQEWSAALDSAHLVGVAFFTFK